MVERISGHSFRVGAAQQLTINGLQLLPIMRAGDWRSTNIVARCVENMDSPASDLLPGCSPRTAFSYKEAFYRLG